MNVVTELNQTKWQKLLHFEHLKPIWRLLFEYFQNWPKTSDWQKFYCINSQTEQRSFWLFEILNVDIFIQ